MRCGCLPPCHPPKLEDHQPPLAYGIILAPVSLRPGIKVSRRGYQALLALKTKMPFEMTEDLKAADGKIFPYKPSRYFHQQNCLESNKINTSIHRTTKVCFVETRLRFFGSVTKETHFQDLRHACGALRLLKMPSSQEQLSLPTSTHSKSRKFLSH